MPGAKHGTSTKPEWGEHPTRNHPNQDPESIPSVLFALLVHTADFQAMFRKCFLLDHWDFHSVTLKMTGLAFLLSLRNWTMLGKMSQWQKGQCPLVSLLQLQACANQRSMARKPNHLCIPKAWLFFKINHIMRTVSYPLKFWLNNLKAAEKQLCPLGAPCHRLWAFPPTLDLTLTLRWTYVTLELLFWNGT